MSLQSKIETKLSEALKAQDKKTYSTLRLIIAAIKDTIIAKKIKDKNVLPDNDLTTLLKKMVKITLVISLLAFQKKSILGP